MNARPTLVLRLGAAFWAAMLAALAAGTLLPSLSRLPLALAAALVLAPAALVLAGLLLRPLRGQVAGLTHDLERLGDAPAPARDVLPELRELAAALPKSGERLAAGLREAEARSGRLRAVLDGMFEGVMVLDGDCRAQGVNRSMESLLPGVSDRLGRRLLEILPQAELADACDELLRAGGPDSASLAVTLEDGRVLSVNMVRPPESGHGLGAVLVFRDVSEIKRLEAVRRDFAANVSHELRTPLTAIKGYAETLITGDPPPDIGRRFLEVILRNSDHMAKMIEDLLSLSRIEAGKDVGRREPMQARDSLRRAWDAVEPLARRRGVDLADGLPEGLAAVLGDPDHVTRIFRNLLENAVKFGPEHRPVTVSAREAGEFVEFEVRDEGPGIPKKDQSRVFERFYSVQKHRRNEHGSTGLGLAICRHALKSLGGDIRVESPPPDAAGGTAFLFTLPRA
ncbi:cell wall metabolism sensor histidine kinase WalK [Desulfovibrio aminophilus]|nr:ATP-binding protein [Desulfovibrio aminophilus]MCM0755400.1 cell wall metabolism sensor histidine kinase WalK [Desulfovibrio aminophilus]